MSSLLKRAAFTAATLTATVVFAAPVYALECSTKGGIGCQSDDGQFATEFGGRIQVDGGTSGDGANVNSDGVEFRRLRFFNKFTLYDRYFGKVQIDFAEDAVDIEDAYVGLKHVLFARDAKTSDDLRIGQEKIPSSLNEMTSSKYTTFIERAAITELITGRQIGVGHHAYGKSQDTPWTSFFRVYSTDGVDQDQDDGSSSGNELSDGLGVGGRITAAPQLSGTSFVHLGGSVNYEINIDDEGSFGNFPGAVEPEAHLSDDIDVFGGTRPSAPVDILRYGAEAAFVTGPFSAQGEYLVHEFDDNSGFSQDVAGWYAFGSWFITPGDHRSYDAGNGAFGRVKPKNKYGAIEVAARYSSLENDDVSGADIENATGLPAGIVPFDGTQVEVFTFAVNWYPNSHTRVMFNYLRPDIDGVNEDTSGGDSPPVLIGDSPEIFLIRFQADYGD